MLLLACLGFPQDEWQFKPGVVMASGSRDSALKDIRGRLLTVNGYRRVSAAKLEEISVYHAIIFYPEATTIGSGSSSDGPLSTEEITWEVQKNPPGSHKDTEEKRLKIKYHALDKNISVGPETFSLSGGNLFIIRLDESWLPGVTQLKAHFSERAEQEKVLGFFKSVLREDEEIQKLEFY